MARKRSSPSGVPARSGLFAPPEGISAGTRWLFLWLAGVSMMLLLPPIAALARGPLLTIALVSALGLIFLWGIGYLRRQSQIWTAMLDSAGLLGIALASPDPHAILPVMFGVVCFRSLTGTGRQNLARGALYAATVTATFLIWPSLHPEALKLDATAVMGSFPTMFLSIFIFWKLGRILVKRDESLARDRILVTAGTLLQATTDEGAILAVAWSLTEQFCAVTPGLRVVHVHASGRGLIAEGAAGPMIGLPLALPHDMLEVFAGGASARIVDPDALNRAAGTALMWECLRLDHGETNGWLLVGAPGAVPVEAILSIRGLLGQVVLAVRNGRAHEELVTQARTDSLTGLDNRGSFTRKVSGELAGSASKTGLRVLFLDLDNFKDVNDRFGHRAGDELLIGVGRRLQEGTRDRDFCARLGGDEFAVLLHDASDEVAIELAERLVTTLAEPFVLDDYTLVTGASIGIATAAAAHDLEDLLHQADIAMYAAKDGGKGRVVVFHSDLAQLDQAHTSLNAK